MPVRCAAGIPSGIGETSAVLASVPPSVIMTPMYGPAVRCKRFRRSGFLVLHQCIRPRIGATSVAPGHHGYQRAIDLISGQASNWGPKGSPVFDRAGKTVLHLIDFSRRPRQVNLGFTWRRAPFSLIHRISLVRSRLSPVPTCKLLTASRARLVEAGRGSDVATMCSA